jgi:hypothetical protein
VCRSPRAFRLRSAAARCRACLLGESHHDVMAGMKMLFRDIGVVWVNQPRVMNVERICDKTHVYCLIEMYHDRGIQN